MKSYLGIDIHETDPDFVSEYGKLLYEEHYLQEGESISEGIARAVTNFCYGDYDLAQRLYNYAFAGDFMFASPVLSNAIKGEWKEKKEQPANYYWHNHEFIPFEKQQGQPISCFAFTVPDTIKGQKATMQEIADLSTSGGGTGAHNEIRATSKKAPGPIPYMKVVDACIGYYKQKGSRRGAIAYYMDVNHPDIVEHIRFRKPGGDPKRKTDNRKQFHSAVNLTDEFIEAVFEDKDFDLKCPHSGRVYETIKARDLWQDMIETRALTGEPYMLKIDQVNQLLPDSQKKLGLKIKGSNLCSEIILPTDDLRTFVCCLSSLNLERYDEWKNTSLVADLVRFLDNILQWFIDTVPDSMHKAKYSAGRERAMGIGFLGWHGYLQSKMIPFEGGGFGSAIQHINIIHSDVREKAIESSKQLARERGEPDDMKGTGLRNSRLFAIAPNSNSGDLANTSASIEPLYRNVFLKDTRIGIVEVRNKHLEKLLESKGFNTKETWDIILKDEGSVANLDCLSKEEKEVFKEFTKMDMHWLIEQANERGKYICQAQSLNLFFPFGSNRKYVNSVHLKYLRSPHVHTLYYYRTEKETNADNVKLVERQALIDWKNEEECVSCQG